ncbi:MAG TPA: hypothetical protein VGH87_06285 [Polyangiaceae bacterium]|jgi:hypothetical protein
MSLDLDLKDDEDRELLKALPTIAAALLSRIAESPARIVVVFSTRKRAPEVKVLTRELESRDELDEELQRPAATAPKMPKIRVVCLRRSGAAWCRDVKIDELTNGEETAPA